MLGQKIKELRKSRKWSQEELARLLKVHQTAVSQWESGKTHPDRQVEQKLCRLFNVTMGELYGTDIALTVPILGSIPAGIPVSAIEDISGYEELSRKEFHSGSEYFALRVRGESMMPEYKDGDTVIFEKRSDILSGSDCAVIIGNDEATFKRVKRVERGIMVQPVNPEYTPLFFTYEEMGRLPVTILGVAVELRRKL